MDLDQFGREGFLGPLSLLSSAECSLLRNYTTSGEMAEPATWYKGLAVSDRLICGIATKQQLRDILIHLLGPDVWLWGATIVTRAPGQLHSWHTDIETSSPEGRFVTVWVGFQGTSRKASLRFIPRSHRIGKPLQQVAAERGVKRADRAADVALGWARERFPEAGTIEPEMTDGDALLLDGRLWHGSLNESNETRRALLLQYAAAGQSVRIPDFGKPEWPFAFTDTLAPVVSVLGTATAPGHVADAPAPVSHATRLAEPFCSPVVPSPDGRPWTSHHLFRGGTAHLDGLSAHFSHLQPGHSPHARHAHVEEETLIVVDGEAEVVVGRAKDDPTPDIHVLRTGDFVYYPAYQWHTIRNVSAKPVTYLMFKWRGVLLGLANHVGFGVFRDAGEPAGPAEKPLRTRRMFEGPTNFLAKLHAHRTWALPGAGYTPHSDAHDVLIVLCSGALETLGQEVAAPAVFYHPAGTPHGLRAAGERTASYLVVEMHGPASRDAESGSA